MTESNKKETTEFKKVESDRESVIRIAIKTNDEGIHIETMVDGSPFDTVPNLPSILSSLASAVVEHGIAGKDSPNPSSQQLAEVLDTKVKGNMGGFLADVALEAAVAMDKSEQRSLKVEVGNGNKAKKQD